MNTDAIIKQLEKALNKKDDKELRLRVEVLVDILKENRMPIQPIQPIQPRFDNTPIPKPTVTAQPKINGPGAIVGGGEQINYKRPPNT